MALNWGNIKTLVEYNLGRQGDTKVATLLPLWAAQFQLEAERDRNYWFLKTISERTIGSTAQTYALPSGYKDDLLVYLVFTTPTKSFYELRPLTDHDVVRKYAPVTASTDKAQPQNFLIANESITFWPYPDQDYTARLVGWKDVEAPSSSSADSFTNTWISKYSDLYEQGLTAKGFRYLQEHEDAKEWEAKQHKTLIDLRAQHVARELPSEMQFVPRADAYGSTIGPRPAMGWYLR